MTGDGVRQFAYDARGRLIQVTTGQGSFQYQINALGQRVAKLAAGTGGTQTLFADTFPGSNGRSIDDQADGLWKGGGKKKAVAHVRNGQAVIAEDESIRSQAIFKLGSGGLSLKATLVRGVVGLVDGSDRTAVKVHYNGERRVVVNIRGQPEDERVYKLNQSGLPLQVQIDIQTQTARVTITSGAQKIDTGAQTVSALVSGSLWYVRLAATHDGQALVTGIVDDVKLTGGSATTSSATYFGYDLRGHLIAEYGQTAQPTQEIVWLDDQPVATIRNNVVYAIYSDHLDTPRVITDPTNRVIWRWDSDPFGASAATEDPDADGQSFTFNLRFPGQYIDKETGLHYNYYRDYDPGTGRYVESDPIGLEGGINTYGYVNGDPVSEIDSFGLMGRAPGRGPYPPGYGPGSGTITITTRGVCDGQPANCAEAMQRAGISEPYFGANTQYDLNCLMTWGVIGKVGGATAGNVAASQVPRAAAAAGAGPRTMAIVTRGAAIWTNPWTTAGALLFAVPTVFEHCEVKRPPACVNGK